MAQIGIIETFHASHGSKSHEHDFKVEIILEGKIDQQTEFVEGIDHCEVIADVKKIISKLENQDLKSILTNESYKSSGNESIAIYFIRLLKEKFPIKCVKIWETESRYAIVFSDEV
jgi:6-pyruvoyl-tetrahydropterin synthase